MQKILFPALLCFAFSAQGSTQELELPQAAVKDEAALAEAMPGLAKRAIAIYQEPDRDRYLYALFRLQMVAGQYAEAVTTIRSLTELRKTKGPANVLRLLPSEIMAKAKARQAASGQSFEDAFKQEFHDIFDRLDDKGAYEAVDWFGAASDLNRGREDLRAAVEKQKGKDGISLTDALDLIRKHHFYHAIQAWLPLTNAL